MDLKKIAFTSEYRYERIATKSHVDFVTTSFNASLTIPHNLGYEPFNEVFVKFDDMPGEYYQVFEGQSAGLGSWIIPTYYADTTNIYISFTYLGASNSGGTVYYRIYEEPLL